MADLYHYMGGDLSVSATGDLALADGTTLGEQRVLRRLLTVPGAYIWQLPYGAGLPRFVGLPVNPARIAAVTKSQMFRERAVARSPMPVIGVNAQPTGVVTLNIQYVDAPSQTPATLNFNING